MKPNRLLYIALIAGIAVWWWLGQSGDAETQIRARLDSMQKIMVKEADEKALESADRARRFVEFLAQDFLLHLEPIGQEISDPAALARPFVGFRRQVGRLEVDFSSIEIEVAASGGSASSEMIVSLNAPGDSGRRGSYKVTIRWQRANDWVVEEMQVVESLRGGSFF